MLAQPDYKDDDLGEVSINTVVPGEEEIHKNLKEFLDRGCVFMDSLFSKRYVDSVEAIIKDFKKVAHPKEVKFYLESRNTFILSDSGIGIDGVRKLYRIINSKRLKGEEDIYRLSIKSTAPGYNTLVEIINKINTFYGYKFFAFDTLFHDTHSVIERILALPIRSRILQYNVSVNEREQKMLVSIKIQNDEYIRIKSEIQDLEKTMRETRETFDLDQEKLKKLHRLLSKESFVDTTRIEFSLITPSENF